MRSTVPSAAILATFARPSGEGGYSADGGPHPVRPGLRRDVDEALTREEGVVGDGHLLERRRRRPGDARIGGRPPLKISAFGPDVA